MPNVYIAAHCIPQDVVGVFLCLPTKSHKLRVSIFQNADKPQYIVSEKKYFQNIAVWGLKCEMSYDTIINPRWVVSGAGASQ